MDGIGLGLCWGWVVLGLKFGSLEKNWVPKKSRRSGGWVVGCVRWMGGWDRRKIMPTSSHNPFGFFHRSECGKICVKMGHPNPHTAVSVGNEILQIFKTCIIGTPLAHRTI